MAVTRFEELVAWQRALGLCRSVHAAIRSSSLQHDWVLSDQLWRSAVSVPSNVAEGFERFNRTEFGRFLLIAKASCGELRCQLHIARGINSLDAATADALIDESEHVSRLIGALKTSLTRTHKD